MGKSCALYTTPQTIAIAMDHNCLRTTTPRFLSIPTIPYTIAVCEIDSNNHNARQSRLPASHRSPVTPSARLCTNEFGADRSAEVMNLPVITCARA